MFETGDFGDDDLYRSKYYRDKDEAVKDAKSFSRLKKKGVRLFGFNAIHGEIIGRIDYNDGNASFVSKEKVI